MTTPQNRQYIAIDLKSFYASAEAAARGYDALDVHLVVADESRTDKTICLAVSPSLKAYGIPGRARLFEARQRLRDINSERRRRAPGGRFTGRSVSAAALAADPSLEADMMVVPPRMRYYMACSRRIVGIYLRYISPEDLLVYSVDEVFIDATPYLTDGGMSARELALRLVREVLRETRITATAGIGTNLYLAKVAMDIVAKHMAPDADGVRIAELDERRYRETLWCHRPLTDFWRVGSGTARRLERNGLLTMGDVARCSEGAPDAFYNEELLYRLFGVNAELLIDHAWGWEPVRIADCKAYTPSEKSLTRGQVLSAPYTAEKGRVVVREMADLLSLDLVRKGLVTDQVELYVGYDVENLRDPFRAGAFRGEAETDHYGRRVPKGAHASCRLETPTSSTAAIEGAVGEMYDRAVDKTRLVRRLHLSVLRLLTGEEAAAARRPVAEQLDLFTDYAALQSEREAAARRLDRERRVQTALIGIRERFGKNAVLRGLNFREGATARERNGQVGGHKA